MARERFVPRAQRRRRVQHVRPACAGRPGSHARQGFSDDQHREPAVYAGGEDDEFVKELTRRGVTPDRPAPIPSRPGNVKSAVFALPDGISAGAALCWEQCRLSNGAAARRGKVDLVLAASGWPFVAPDGGISRSNPAEGHDALGAGAGIREAPRRLARLTGAPVGTRQPRRRCVELATQRPRDRAEVLRERARSPTPRAGRSRAADTLRAKDLSIADDRDRPGAALRVDPRRCRRVDAGSGGADADADGPRAAPRAGPST